MLRRNAFFILGVVVLLAIAITGAFAQLSDPETATGNTFTAGTIDLAVNGENGNVTAHIFADNMDPQLPGQTRNEADFHNDTCLKLENVGTQPGRLNFQVTNPSSDENGRQEPELDAGDPNGEVNAGYVDYNSGKGELWDQLVFQFCIAENNDGECDGSDILLYSNYGDSGSDYSGGERLPLDTDLVPGSVHVDIPVNGHEWFCVDALWVGDTTDDWHSGGMGVTNNLAMSDSAVFDIVFKLVQFE